MKAGVCASVVVMVLLSAGAARAGKVDDLMTADERAVLVQLEGAHFIKARDLAEKVLAKNPKSFIGTWAMARVHHDEEGNHARALFFVKRAEELLGDRDREWGIKLLLEEYDIVFEMNRNADALDALDRLDEKYGASPPSLRIWPLFKLGKNAESRKIAMALTSSNDPDDRSNGFNGLLSIAFEEHDRDGCYRWAMEGVRATRDLSCTLLRNAGTAAYGRFKVSEVEDLLVRAGKAKDCSDPVDTQLAALYLLMGDLQKAISALKGSRVGAIEKRFRPQFALVRRSVLCDLLMAMGKGNEALKIAAELYAQPQRTGMTSGPAKVERLARTFRYAVALDGRLALLREQASYGPLLSAGRVSREMADTLATHWEVRRALTQLVAEEDRLVLLTRPNLGEITDWSTWRVGDLTALLGAGVMKAALERARQLDSKLTESGPWLDALDGELAWRGGDFARADLLAKRALEGLPREEALLRWRTRAWQADLLLRAGRTADARAAYLEVAQRWPTVFRILDLALPATLVADGAAISQDIASRLGRSRRFELSASAPFKLRVDGQKEGATICLVDEAGARLACGSGKDANEALDAFHATAFSPRISLNETDLHSLDGSPVRVGADEALKKVLEP